jgi:tetratricopeptide (TPR) repeat protein
MNEYLIILKYSSMRQLLLALYVFLWTAPIYAQRGEESQESQYASVICAPPSEFPARKTALLNALPKHSPTKQEVMGFLSVLHAELKKKYPAPPVQHAMAIIAKFGDNIDKIAFTGAAAWYNGAPVESILLLTYAGSKDPKDVTLNNCGAIMNLLCMQEKALYVLKHVLPKEPKNCTLLNNIGQAFAGLGEKDSAMRYFNQVFEICQYHPDANATASCIAYSRGLKEEAANYMERSLRGAYSEQRMEFYMAIAQNPKKIVKDDAVNPEKEEFFQSNGFGPATNCRSWTEAEKTYAEQEAVKKIVQKITMQYSQVIMDNTLDKILADPIEKQKFDKGIGWTPGPLSRKAMYIIQNLGSADADFSIFEKIADISTRSLQRRAAIDESFRPRFEACVKQGNCPQVTYQHCVALEKEDNQAFGELADLGDSYKSTSYPKDIKWYNDAIYLSTFTTPNPRARKADCAAYTMTFINKIPTYTLSPGSLGRPNCVPPQPAQQSNPNDPFFRDGKCVVNINIPFVVGRLNLNCEEFGIEVGEGVTFRYGKNFRTQETTLAVGVGAGLDIPGVDIGVSAEVAVKFDGNNQVVDVMGSAEAGAGMMGIDIASAGASVGINSSFTPYMNVIGN